MGSFGDRLEDGDHSLERVGREAFVCGMAE